MADSKIDFSFENLHFSCEGDNAWVERQLNNVLSRIPSLLAVHRKGENMVEEVIDVQEFTSQPAKPKKAPKPVKAKKVVAAKKEVVEELVVKAPKVAKAPKAPKIKAPKAPKAAKIPKEKSIKEPKVKVPKPTKEKKIVKQADSPLYQFLLEKKADKNQIRKFLATAIYLAKSNDLNALSTIMISRALKSSGIEKLQNPSDCLKKNEKKGYCAKEGKIFTITENGFLSIG